MPSLPGINAMSFQNAQAFYETLGYKMVFESQGHTNGSSGLFLRRAL